MPHRISPSLSCLSFSFEALSSTALEGLGISAAVHVDSRNTAGISKLAHQRHTPDGALRTQSALKAARL